ncbi:unnamed protein product [Durusdinium trenchii]|uniref:C3H1-type domain-containing protein n=1 Tax=Durusdinium trenchii TaxID=1381693 RepID=A0ABP0IJX7_9DINO
MSLGAESPASDASPVSPESAGTTCVPSEHGSCKPWSKDQEELFPQYVEMTFKTTLSRGSFMHPDACKPCAWFWHAKGCQSGTECNFCHLCPRGALRSKQALKREARRSGSLADAGPEDLVLEEETTVSVYPSLGSSTHGNGECRPCAWFWKEGGCKNGKDCRHCHLCPEGEIRRKKKMKHEEMRMLKRQTNASSALDQQFLQMQLLHQWQAHMYAANMIQSSLASLSLDPN